MKWAKQTNGFTIVELLIVVVVIAVLAAITIVSYAGIQQRAVVASLSSAASTVSKKVALYQVENNRYPIVIDDCPSPAAANICLPAAADITFMYRINNATNPQEYSLAVSKNTQKFGIVNGGSVTDKGANLLPTGTAEKTGTNEWLKYQDLAPIIDSWGLRPYTISFDIKSANIANYAEARVYMQNGNGSKYVFAVNVPVTTSYVRRSVTVTPALSTISTGEVDSYLAFYGNYGTGNILSVKNVRVEIGN